LESIDTHPQHAAILLAVEVLGIEIDRFSHAPRLTVVRLDRQLIAERGAAPLLHAAKPRGASWLSYERGTAPLLHAAKPRGSSWLSYERGTAPLLHAAKPRGSSWLSYE